MFSQLLLNFCLLVTLIYLLSLTYRSAPEMLDRRPGWKRVTLLSLLAVALMLYPANVLPGIFIDMRVVAIAFLAWQYGLGAGLFGLVPLLLYRIFIGGSGVPAAVISALSVVLAAWLVGRSVNLFARELDHRTLWWKILLVFAVNGPVLPLLQHNLQLYLTVYLPLMALGYTGFWITLGMLRNRFRLLQLLQTYAQQAQQDHLSDLLNRRQFDQDMQTLVPGDLLCLVDIDHFKAINDTFGHTTGDQVLAQLGEVLQTRLRKTDKAYRYGGEEFAVIFRSPGTAQPMVLAERIRKAIEETTFSVLPDGKLTVSVGVTRYQTFTTSTEALQQADQALYAAKAAGRNRTVLWSPELGSTTPDGKTE